MIARVAVRESVTLAGRAERARAARVFVSEVLGSGHPCGDVAVLLVSEIFGNSVRHSDLGAWLTAPGCARAWTRQILWEWHLTGLSDTAELIVSELTTNSVLASGHPDQPAIRLILVSDRHELVILVRDFDPGIPVPRHASEEDDESGRGLLLVETLSGRLGWYRPDDGAPGKVMWAVVSPE